MSIKATIKQYVGDYREFYATDLFKFVRGILGRPLLHDDSIIRKLRELRDEKYIVECLDHQKSFYLVRKEVEEYREEKGINLSYAELGKELGKATKNLTLF